VTPDPAQLQLLLDRSAIREVLVRYYHGADSGDEAVVRSCFTQDVRAHYDGRTPVAGLDALMAQIPLFRNLACGACTICTHFMGNLRFLQLGADAAETEAHVFAFLVVPEGGGNVVNMRSLRYLDRWRREAGDWKIAVRQHTLDWSCQVPASFTRSFAQRLGAIPEGLQGG
jgi:hypothetical protein